MKARISSLIRCAALLLALIALHASSSFALESVQGVVGGALQFDGIGDYVKILNHDTYHTSHNNAITIEAWFRVDELIPGQPQAG